MEKDNKKELDFDKLTSCLDEKIYESLKEAGLLKECSDKKVMH